YGFFITNNKNYFMNTRNLELEAIRKTINLYIDGVRDGNNDLLRQAFHPKAMMYGASGDNITLVEIEGLYQYVAANEAPSKRDEPHQCFITAIDYAGNAASVELVEESSHGVNYTNYFHLLKIDGKWVIVCKTYDAVVRK
ncbi:MAG: nuclear transport factor 2 family protein, partial [Chitinophagaceae bacterium]